MTITTAVVEPLPAGALVARKQFVATVTAGTDEYVEDAASSGTTRLLQAYIQTNSPADVLLIAGAGGSTVLRIPGTLPGVVLPYNPLGWCEWGAGQSPRIDVSTGAQYTRAALLLARVGGDTPFSSGAQRVAPTPAGAERHRLEIDEATGANVWEDILSGVTGKTLRVESGVLTNVAGSTIELGQNVTGRRLLTFPQVSASYSRLDLPPSPYGWAESPNGGALQIRTHLAAQVRGHLIVAEIDDAE